MISWSPFVSDRKCQYLAFILEKLGCLWRFLRNRMARLKKMVGRTSHKHLRASISSVASLEVADLKHSTCAAPCTFSTSCEAVSQLRHLRVCAVRVTTQEVPTGQPELMLRSFGWRGTFRVSQRHPKMASCLWLDWMCKTGRMESSSSKGSLFGKGNLIKNIQLQKYFQLFFSFHSFIHSINKYV